MLDRVSIVSERAQIDGLVFQIARLVRDRGYVRANVVSAMLLRYLPGDAGYAWNGEGALHASLAKAALGGQVIEHLTAAARLEIAMIRERSRL